MSEFFLSSYQGCGLAQLLTEAEVEAEASLLVDEFCQKIKVEIFACTVEEW